MMGFTPLEKIGKKKGGFTPLSSWTDTVKMGIKTAGNIALSTAEIPLAPVSSLAGGMVEFMNPIPGIAGMAKYATEGYKTGSYDKALEESTKTIQGFQEFFHPYLVYRPQTATGKKAQEYLGKILDFFIGTPSRIAGEFAQDITAPVTGKTGGTFIGAGVNIGAELAGYGILFKGLHGIKNKIAKGEKLTPQETIQFERNLQQTAEKIQKEVGTKQPAIATRQPSKGFTSIENLPIIEEGKPKVMVDPLGIRPIKEITSPPVRPLVEELKRPPMPDSTLINKITKGEAKEAIGQPEAAQIPLKQSLHIKEGPTIISHRNVGNGIIYLEFDDKYAIPSTAQIKEFIDANVGNSDVQVTKFSKNIISGARKGTNYRIDVFTADGRISRELADRVSVLFGKDNFRGTTEYMRGSARDNINEVIRIEKRPEAPIPAKRAEILSHPSGTGFAIKVGENRWISGGTGVFGGGNIGQFATMEKAIAEAKRLGYKEPTPTDFSLTAEKVTEQKPTPIQQTLVEVQPKFPETTIKKPYKEGFEMADEIKAREAEQRQQKITYKKTSTQGFNPETDSLSDFIRKEGGLSLKKEFLKGEVKRYSIKEGFNLINNKTGKTLDHMTESAWEAGFFKERPTITEFLDATEKDVSAKQNKTFNRVWSSGKDLQSEEMISQMKGFPGEPEAGSLAYGQPLPKYAENINLERIGADYSVKKLILDTADRYKGQIDEARRGTITLETTKELARNLDMTVEDLLKRRKGEAFNAEESVAARNILDTSGRKLGFLLKESVKTGSDEALVNFRLAWDRHAGIQAQVSGVAAEAGRSLSAFRNITQKTKNHKAILNVLGGRELTQGILDKMAKIDINNPVEINRFVREMSKVKTTDMIFEAWVNFLLSAPPTHIVNTTSNTLTFLSKIPEEGVAASIDFLRAGITRTPRERFWGESPRHIYGLWEGIKKGTRAGLESFKTEMPSQAISKLEVTKYQAIPGKLGRMVRIPGRALIAADEFFKAINYQAEIHSLAYRQAVKEGLEGKARIEKIAEIISNPPYELMKTAKEEMLYRVFQAELGKSGKVLQNLRTQTPGLKYIMPFLRTPANIAKFGLERTPLNYPLVLRKILKGELKGGVISDELAKPMIGTILAATTAIYVKEGYITGGGPKDKTKLEALYRTGWQPYSLRIGDNYYSYGRLEPLGTIIGLTADFMEISDTMSEGEKEDIVARISLSMARNITNKTYMQGLSRAMDAVSDPVRYGASWTEKFVGTAIPRGVAALTKAIDPTLKNPQTIRDIFKAQLPFLSEDVIPRRDLWGEPIILPGGVESLISPVRRSEIKTSKLDNEMVRLKIFLSLPTNTIKGIKLTPQEYDILQTNTGRLARKMLDRKVNTSSYDLLREEGKKKMITDIIMAIRDRERNILYGKIRQRKPLRSTINENKREDPLGIRSMSP